jgi:hypothetical protein
VTSLGPTPNKINISLIYFRLVYAYAKKHKVLRNVGAEYADMMVESFPGIKTEQLHRVIERRDLGSPETVIIHVGTNDMRATTNLDYIMGDVYALVTMAKKKLPNCRLVLSGVL